MIDLSSLLYYIHYVITTESANKYREESKLAREAKKLEAMERSKQRQQSEDYFKQRQVANNELILKQQREQQAVVIPVEHNSATLEGKEGDDEENDPFRITKKSKSKIFVR
jgi:hypothetical protein